MKEDASWYSFFSKPERFADTINCFGCEGKEILKASDIKEADSKAVISTSSKQGYNTKYRDIVRHVAIGMNFAIIGIENQETIDFSYPLRELGYTYDSYEKQAKLIRSNNKTTLATKENITPKLLPGEYLYNFLRSDTLKPSVTFMIYSGKDTWAGPKSLHDMLDFTDIPYELKNYIQDYKINLIEIRRESDDTLDMLKTDVKQVFKFIKYSENKDKIKDLLQNDKYYSHMKEDAYEVISLYTKLPKTVGDNTFEKEGEINMCKAFYDLMEESRNEGYDSGYGSGYDSGYGSGYDSGYDSGLILTINCLKNIYHSAEEIFEVIKENNSDADISLNKVEELMNR